MKVPTTIQDIHDQLRKIDYLLLQQNNRLGQTELFNQTSLSSNISNTEPFIRSAVKYCILAYDPTKQDVVISQTTSRAPTSQDKPMLLTEALAAVDKPGKFLTELVKLHNDGFVVVTATHDTVVVKKASAVEDAQDKDDAYSGKCAGRLHAETEPVVPKVPLEEIRYQPEDNAGQMQEETVSSAPKASNKEEKKGSTSSDNKIRREEAVFSGLSGKNWQTANNARAIKGHKRGTKGSGKVKHVIVTGTITAACCYAVGVMSQMMQ